MEGMTMSSKSSTLALAKALVEKDGLGQEAAENFVKTMFEIANEGLQTDKLVKMRWLGSFKVLAVKDRESVDVNTGERIVIEGRDKISFTPDNILKEIVNKPFAQFETVTVNEGVDFTGIDEKFARQEAEEREREDSENAAVVPVTEVNASEAEEEIEENVPEAEEEMEENVPEAEEEMEENVPETGEEIEENVPETEEEIEESVPEPEVREKRSAPVLTPASGHSRSHAHLMIPRNMVVAACFLIFALVAGMGWFAFSYGKMSAQRDYLAHQRDFLSTQLKNTAKQHQAAAPKPVAVPVEEDSLQDELKRKAQEDSARMAKVSEAIELTDPAKEAAKKEGKAAAKKDKETAKKEDRKAADEKKSAAKEEEKLKKAEPTELSDKYDSDIRIRTGAYRIVGVAQTVKVRAGQTLTGISKAYLGAGMECYVEALNGVSQVTVGQELKIPKLELKKRAKKSL